MLDLMINNFTYKPLVGTIFESQELRVESEDNVLLRSGVLFAVPCSSDRLGAKDKKP
jgi:hypothetical protein